MRPTPDCSVQGRSTDRHLTQASRGGYCTVPQCLHCWSSNRPAAAAAVICRAARLCSAIGPYCAAESCCPAGSPGAEGPGDVGELGRCKDGCSTTQAPIIV